ncbi:MAG: alpha/beta hydrolase [Polyangiales bacterium]
MNEEVIQGSTGLKLFMRTWRPMDRTRAVIILVHGFKAHSGVFEWAAERLVEHGLAVYAVDLRGHGKSEGERLWVDHFDDYLLDLEKLVELARWRDPGKPLFLLGHSAGGVVSSAYVIAHQNQLEGFICESFAQEVPAPDVVLSVIKGLSRVAPHLGVFDLKDEDFSRDRAFVERMKHDPLIPHVRYPSQTVAELRRAEERLAHDFPRMKLPVLILHGTNDKVTKPHGSQLLFDTTGSPDKKLRLYDGHFHDLLNDVGKEQVMTDITHWLDARLTS